MAKSKTQPTPLAEAPTAPATLGIVNTTPLPAEPVPAPTTPEGVDSVPAQPAQVQEVTFLPLPGTLRGLLNSALQILCVYGESLPDYTQPALKAYLEQVEKVLPRYVEDVTPKPLPPIVKDS